MKTNPTPRTTPARGQRRCALALAACIAGWLSAPALGQDLTVKAPPQSRPVAIVNAMIHPVSSAPIEQGYVLFDAGTIRAVGAMGDAPTFPDGTEVINAKGQRVYPGFIAPATQIGLVEINSVRATRDFLETGDTSPEVVAAVAVNADSTLIPVTRQNGVLSFGAFPSGGGTFPGTASVMQNEGWTWEEMTVRRGAGLVVSWPLMRVVRSPFVQRSEAEQSQDINRRVSAIRDAFQGARAYLAQRASDPSTPVDVRWEAFGEALGGRASPQTRPVFVEAQDYDQITAAVAFADEMDLRIVIVGGRDAGLCADLLRQRDIPVIVDAPVLLPRRDDSPYDENYGLAGRLEKAGVRFTLNTGEETARERNLPYSAGISVAHGLSHDAALRAITLSAAEILGVADQLGSLQPGKRATLFIADGDPLEVTTNISRAFIQGRSVDMSSKHTVLASKYRERYRQQRSGTSESGVPVATPSTPAGPAPTGGPAVAPARGTNQQR